MKISELRKKLDFLELELGDVDLAIPGADAGFSELSSVQVQEVVDKGVDRKDCENWWESRFESVDLFCSLPKFSKISAVACAVFGVLVGLSGCSAPVLSGTVVEKTHQDSYISQYQSCISYNMNTGGCSQWMTNYDVVPESWSVKITGQNRDGKTNESTYDVSESDWNEISVGESLTFDDHRNLISHVKN